MLYLLSVLEEDNHPDQETLMVRTAGISDGRIRFPSPLVKF